MTTISTAGLDRPPFAATSRAARGAGQFDLYRRAVRLAGIGIWECDLATDRLSWSEGVYDLFGIDRSARLDRRDIVQLYDEDSRREMEWLRARAIRDGSGFSIDARIHRLDGTCRWMRLTAGVELQNGRPRRLFGTKQDVTEERVLRERLRTLAESDPLTMLANRAMFDRWL
ncbi:MAG: PAS domain S-box protein, partial [Sphingomonas sp.]